MSYEPKIAAFLCNWCSYAGADLAGIGRLQYPPHIRVIRVPCSGRMNPLFIFSALRNGVDGILVSGCHPGDCHYTSGNYVARRKFALLKSMLNYMGVEEDRVNFTWVSAAEGGRFAEVEEDRVNFTWVSAAEGGRFAEVVNKTSARIKELGPQQGIFKK